MRKIIIYLAVFTVLCFASSLGIDYAIGRYISNQSPYYICFASIGAEVLESRMDSWATLDQGKDDEQLNRDLMEIIHNLDLPVNPEKIQREDSGTVVALAYELDDQGMYINLTCETDQESEITNYMLTIINSDLDRDIHTYGNRLKKNRKLKWNIAFKYTGCIGESVASPEKLVKVMLQNLDAKEYDRYHEGVVFSVAGYSPLLERPAIGKGDKYNVQIASRQVKQEGKTYFYIGSPLILSEY
ncbi:MAG: hypothetical protein GX550_07110 [Syntrophomonadaceae bacterium]|nr:hypothetical protein [Syntrophomonadaceae bacterium]